MGKATFKGVQLKELMTGYQDGLREFGLSYSSQLQMLQRAAKLVRFHEEHGAEYLDEKLVAEFFKALEEKYYSGAVGKTHYQLVRRQTQRLLLFAEGGEVRLPVTTSGARLELTPGYAAIATAFLSNDTLHPNTRNDMRWVAHKYFNWLEEQGLTDLAVVGAEQLQRFLLDCSRQMAPTSLHNVKLHMKKLYAYLYEAGLAKSSYAGLLSFAVNRESKIYPTLPKDDIKALAKCVLCISQEQYRLLFARLQAQKAVISQEVYREVA